MPEEVKEEIKEEVEEKKKGFFGKAKDAILPDAIIVAEVSIREKSKFIKNFRILFSKKLGKSMINFYKYSPSFE